MNSPRRNEIVLISLFIAVIFGVPVGQMAIEMRKGERAQFTDLFRYAPSEKNLREFEAALESKSFFQQTLRPEMQRFLFNALRDPGSQGMMGRNGWIFYRPSVRYLIEPKKPETGETDSAWVQPSNDTTIQDSVVQAIVRFKKQLQERNIELLVMPVPGKAAVYPDMLTRRAKHHRPFCSPTLDLLQKLESNGVATVDLFSAFQRLRREQPLLTSGRAYYLECDTHWTPSAVRLTAQTVAKKITSMGIKPEISRSYQTKRVKVLRHGDILEMMRVPGTQDKIPGQVVECEQVVHQVFGPMVQVESARDGTYMNPVRPGTSTSILVLGDSYCRIYQLPESQSLGHRIGEVGKKEPTLTREGTRKTKSLLPSSAGFPSHLALALNTPVDYIVSDGGASTDVRKKLNINAEILEGKKLVIWEFTERDIALGAKGWQDVPLPPKLAGM